MGGYPEVGQWLFNNDPIILYHCSVVIHLFNFLAVKFHREGEGWSRSTDAGCVHCGEENRWK